MFRNSTYSKNNSQQFFTMNLISPRVVESTVKDEPKPKTDEPKKEMKWAGPTWLILHTLAEKVEESVFNDVRVGLLNTIYTICTLLPCPICATHAKKFLDGINFDTIMKKDDLKKLLFNFHNQVSKEKNLPLYEYSGLSVYSTANTTMVIRNFMYHFSKKSGNIRLISEDLHRTRTIVVLKEWFNDNIKYFHI